MTVWESIIWIYVSGAVWTVIHGSIVTDLHPSYVFAAALGWPIFLAYNVFCLSVAGIRRIRDWWRRA